MSSITALVAVCQPRYTVDPHTHVVSHFMRIGNTRCNYMQYIHQLISNSRSVLVMATCPAPRMPLRISTCRPPCTSPLCGFFLLFIFLCGTGRLYPAIHVFLNSICTSIWASRSPLVLIRGSSHSPTFAVP